MIDPDTKDSKNGYFEVADEAYQKKLAEIWGEAWMKLTPKQRELLASILREQINLA